MIESLLKRNAAMFFDSGISFKTLSIKVADKTLNINIR